MTTPLAFADSTQSICPQGVISLQRSECLYGFCIPLLVSDSFLPGQCWGKHVKSLPSHRGLGIKYIHFKASLLHFVWWKKECNKFLELSDFSS